MKSLLFGIFFGALISGGYLLLKAISGEKLVLTFVVGAFILTAIMTPFTLTKKIPRPVIMPVSRGLAFAVSQILLLRSIQNGEITNGFVAAFIGSLLPLIFLYYYDRQLRYIYTLCGAALIIFVFFKGFTMSLNAVASGLVLGSLNVVTSISALKYKHENFWPLYFGFFFSSIFILFLNPVMVLSTVSPVSAFAAAGIIICCQISYLYLFSKYNQYVASVFSLMRIVWAPLIVFIVYGRRISLVNVAGLLVMFLFCSLITLKAPANP